MELIIDRFEGKFAVCQEKTTCEKFDIDRKLLPSVKEGDLVEIQVKVLDNTELQKEIEDEMQDLWK